MANPWTMLLGKKADQLAMMNQDPSMETATMGGYEADPMADAIASMKADPLEQALYAQQMQAIEQQERGIAGLEEKQKALANVQTQPDLSAVIGLTDYLSGAQAAKTYEKPMTQAEADKLKFTLQNEIEKRRSGVTGDIADVLRTKLAAKRGLGSSVDPLRQQRYEESQRENNVQKLQKNVGDMIPSINEKLMALNNIVNKYDTEALPGVGPAAGTVPDFMLGEDGSAIRSYAKGVMSDLIKVQSGTAASDKEVERKLKERGMAWDSKPSTFVRGLKTLSAELVSQLKNKQSAYKPEVVELYKERGGMTYQDIPVIETKEKIAPRGTTESSGLQPGTTKTGKGGVKYIYKGGPEKDPTSWEKVN